MTTREQSAGDCTRPDCHRTAPPGQRCPQCRGEAAAVDAGIEQSTSELLALLAPAREQATIGRFSDG